MNLSSHHQRRRAPASVVLCLVVILASACGDSPDDSVSDVQCEVSPLIPRFTITGAEVPHSGELTIEGQLSALSIVADVVELTISDGAEVVEFTIENSGVDELGLTPGRPVQIEYWYRQGFEGVAQALRISDRVGVALLVEDGEYGNAARPADLAPFTVSQTDIGCRNRANQPGELNNFALSLEGAGTGAGAVTTLMPGARSIITVDGNDYAAHNLRSTSRHGDVRWTDAPDTYTSFSIARLTDGSSATPPTSAETVAGP